MIARVPVGGAQPYDVLIGTGLADHLPPLLSGAEQVAVLHAPSVAALAEDHAAALRSAGRRVTLLPLPDGEAAKTVTVAARCWDELGRLGFTRSDAIVGVGGGATTDLAGWVAAAWLRGVRVVQVPTTLAGMVDAAVGGKTGVNTTAGKNLVGAFHPPAAVLCDRDVLAGLPPSDYRAGLAEVVKCGFIADPAILEVIEADPPAALTAGHAGEQELIERSVRVKARIVTADLTERGEREYLNYGHTLGHAIERAEGYTWRHGDAVSVGLVFAAALGRALGRLDAPTAARHAAVLSALGLPTRYRPDAFDELVETMRVDKKARGARLRFVVLDGLARPGIATDPPADALRAAYAAVG